MRSIIAVVVLILVSAFGAKAQPVDVALLIGLDVSGSVSEENWTLQRDGVADAIGSPAFGAAITSGQIGRMAIAVMQWGSGAQVVVGWTVLDSRAGARAFAARVREMARLESGATCMGNALVKAGIELMAWDDQASRRVIDISGDGADNCSASVSDARAAVLAQNITINGLPIVTPTEPHIAEWYEGKLIGGPGAFVVIAEGFDSFANAFLRKLVWETAEVLP
ncbi:MAG TPA: DUF1194 domain-containing protein [Salinarimonas sp.]|nr:DUF1194 domain-containing protein [Salinarimonas sp.]